MLNKYVPEIRFKGFSDNWEQRKLEELAEVKDSARISNELWSENGIPYLRSSDLVNDDIQGELFISQETYEKYCSRTGSPQKDDVLFTSGGKVGVVYHKEDDSLVYVQGGAVLYVRTSISEKLNGSFLSTYFSSMKMQKYMANNSVGGTIKHFTLRPANAAPIVLPSDMEQQKIGKFFKDIDNKMKLHQHALDLLKQRKKAFLQKMFPKNGESIPDLRFSGCSEEWELKQLKEIVSYSSSKHSSNHFKNNTFEGLYPVFDANKIIAKIDSFDIEERYLSIIKDGAGVGRLSKRPAESSVIGTMGYLSAKKSSIDFIHAMLTKFEFRKFIVGSTIPHLYFKDYGVIKVHVPSLKEQEKIGNFFKELDDSIVLQEEKIESLKQMKKAFLQKMFV